MKFAIPAMIAAIVAFAAVSTFKGSGPPAPKPQVFKETTTLASALQESERSGKPVFVFFTADWCGPCQSLKRNTLADKRVASFIDEKTISVYVDIDQDQATAQEFSIRGIPTSIVLRGGEVAARTSGYTGPENYLEFLETAIN